MRICHGIYKTYRDPYLRSALHVDRNVNFNDSRWDLLNEGLNDLVQPGRTDRESDTDSICM
jgi:hypothetical protein